jgi:uncharacterized C2H2 Zn-finger protein
MSASGKTRTRLPLRGRTTRSKSIGSRSSRLLANKSHPAIVDSSGPPTRKEATTSMARARTTSKSTTSRQTSGDNTLTCPECGKTFTRPASLGAHRNRAHGVAGASARRSRGRTTSRSGDTSRRRVTAARRQTRSRSRAGSSAGGRSRVDRDALLQTLFPNGLPAREEVIRRANAWLDEAEQLAKAT